MKKDDLVILLIAIILLAGMMITIFFGGEKSRHGVGWLPDEKHRLSFAGYSTGIEAAARFLPVHVHTPIMPKSRQAKPLR